VIPFHTNIITLKTKRLQYRPYCRTYIYIYIYICIRFSELVKKKVNQSHYRPEVPRGFQEIKVPRLRDNGPGWW